MFASTPQRSIEDGEGYIGLILGPMFAGKTSELLRNHRRFNFANLKCLLLKSDIDNRYSDTQVQTHDNVVEIAMSTKLLKDVQMDAYDVILIDEGQFFADIAECAEEWANDGKIVIIAALDSDFQRKPFGNIHNLLCKAEYVVKLSAVCIKCKKSAHFTARIPSTNKLFNSDGTEQQLQVGGREAYIPVCRLCHNRIMLE